MEGNDAAGYIEVTRKSKKRRRNSTSPTITEQPSRASRATKRNEVRSPNHFDVLLEAARDEGAIEEEVEAGIQGDASDEAGEGVLVNEMLNWDHVSEGVGTRVLISDNEEEFMTQCSGQRRVMQFAEEVEREGNLPSPLPSSSPSGSSSDDSAGSEEAIIPIRGEETGMVELVEGELRSSRPWGRFAGQRQA